MQPTSAELLTTDTALAYAVSRGLLAPGAAARVSALGGGVSNVVLLLEGDDARVVVKQALPQLRVEQEWLADPARAHTEAAALRLAGTLTPGSVPEVLDVDPDRHALVIAAAPAGSWDWKSALLVGDVDISVAAKLGELVAAWHRATTNLAGDPTFDQPEAFDQLRLDPYYRATALAHPDLASVLYERLEQLVAERCCLVHGDLSPKNVLIGPLGLWVIDFEVAHVGHPAFDLAFLLNHLFLKAAYRPSAFEDLRASASAFWAAYESHDGLAAATEAAFDHLGPLMLARVDGKSPAEYLDEPTRQMVRTVARSMVAEPPAGLTEAWDRAAEAWR